MTIRFCTTCRKQRDASGFEPRPDSRGRMRWRCAFCLKADDMARTKEGLARLRKISDAQRLEERQAWSERQRNGAAPGGGET